MTVKTCFVVMAIGDQRIDGETITAATLKNQYTDLIKEAIIKARPELRVVRADEISRPGAISSDIIRHLMHSDYVIADVTYPNPNVFYELGLRHACRTGTIIIKNKASFRVPFDIADLRYVEYENTASGLKNLASQLTDSFNQFDTDIHKPDNRFQELAKQDNYIFPNYKRNEETSPEIEAMIEISQSSELLELLERRSRGENVEFELIKAVGANPKASKAIFQAMKSSGELSFRTQSTPQRTRKKK